MQGRLTLGRMQNPVRGILHGTAAILAIIGTSFLVARVSSTPGRIAMVVYGLGLLALYSTSSLYHSIPWQEHWRRRMQRLDHAMIFVLIWMVFYYGKAGVFSDIALIFNIVLIFGVLASLGAVLGILLLSLSLLLLQPWLAAEFGLFISINPLNIEALWIGAGAVVLAGLLALFPALVAYRRALVDGLGVRL